jgi:hypothetical protein
MVRPIQSSSRTIVVNEDENLTDLTIDNTQKNMQEQKLEIPPKKILHNINLKNLEGYENIRKKIKHDTTNKTFIDEMKKIISLFNSSDVKYNENIILFCMQSVEDYISKGKIGPEKLKIVTNILADYFNNDNELITKFVNMQMPRLKQGLLRRIRIKIKNFFLNILESVLD